MEKSSVSVTLALALIAGATGDRALARETGAGAVAALRERLVAAANAGDASTAAAVFAEDAVLQIPGELPLTGRAAIERWWERASSQAPSSTTVVESHEIVPLGEWAFERGAYATVIQPAGEGERRVHGSYFHLLRRDDDGNWRIARAMWNRLPPVVVQDVPRLPR